MSELVDSWYDRGSGGKFITVYPSDDGHFRVLAAELDQVTEGVAGPRILSDRPVRPSSLVHYRYGEFTANRVFTDDGSFESRMVGPDGNVVKDERLAWFSPPPWASSPFPDHDVAVDSAPESMLIGGRFRVRAAIRHANKGGVFRAVDERNGTDVVVKQARAYVSAGLDGKDVRDRLREEARMLDVLAPLGVAPELVALFEEQGHLFLAQEYVPGVSLSTWAVDRAGRDGPEVGEARALVLQLVGLMRTVHKAGLVIRDFKPQNLIVSSSGEIRMIDTEFVAELGQERTFIFTQGFVAPEVEAVARRKRFSPVPEPSSDCFSLGVTVFCMLTALHPGLVGGQGTTSRSPAELAEVLADIASSYPALAAFGDLIVGLTRTDLQQRWSLQHAEEFLATLEAQPAATSGFATAVAVMPLGALDRLVADGVTHLQQGMTPQGKTLWKPSSGLDSDACSSWFGAAGPLAALTRAAQGLQDPSLTKTVAIAAAWIDEHLYAVPRLLPGLCFGRAGTAWALHDAATLLEDEVLACRALELVRKLPTEWPSPDITHGLAGAGLAHLHLWQATGEADLHNRAMVYADALLTAVQRRGDDWLWPTPAGLDSRLAGATTYGFAHGVAGVGAFLLAAAYAVSEHDPDPGRRRRYMEAATGAGDTLVRAACREPHLHWPGAVDHDGAAKGNWCNGTSGIGSFLVRLGAATGEQRFSDLAEQAATATVHRRWTASVGACCGLAGDGQFLIDMADITGEHRYRQQAQRLANAIHTQRGVDGDLELAAGPRAGYDYAQGTAGVLDFLLRLNHGGTRPWTPETTMPAPTGPRPPDAPAPVTGSA